MNITYTVNNPVKADQLIDVFKSVGWNKAAHDIVPAFENSYYVCAWDGKKLIGFARAISDTYYYTSIFDVVVRPKYQKKGIARAMMHLLQEEFAGTYFFLSYTEGNRDFYAKCGFKDNPSCMLIMKDGPSRASRALLKPEKSPFEDLV